MAKSERHPLPSGRSGVQSPLQIGGSISLSLNQKISFDETSLSVRVILRENVSVLFSLSFCSRSVLFLFSFCSLSVLVLLRVRARVCMCLLCLLCVCCVSVVCSRSPDIHTYTRPAHVLCVCVLLLSEKEKARVLVLFSFTHTHTYTHTHTRSRSRGQSHEVQTPICLSVCLSSVC